MKRIVLASVSPRRRALLAALGLDFDVVASGAPEIEEGLPPEQLVVMNACAKCDEVARRLTQPALVIAADTLVFLDSHVLTKPASLDEAREMLKRLSGRTHAVLTGLALADTATGSRVEGFERTEVTFRQLAEDEIAHFVHAVRPVDRAGAYTVDGPGSLLVARYSGCYQNVLGLPIVRLDMLMRELGCSLFELMDHTRADFL
ncbi:MAG TPA: Maf family protein [Candidatus Hydrogenedentes bacterium]|nr:Maf family protein [Candidatus Hydrogenedentota bacterium]HQM47542.1 Maf family protein [Candidatus Hydrogenedentota bacterium]